MRVSDLSSRGLDLGIQQLVFLFAGRVHISVIGVLLVAGQTGAARGGVPADSVATMQAQAFMSKSSTSKSRMSKSAMAVARIGGGEQMQRAPSELSEELS